MSVHSRAAKRASSPSIDTDKSLKNIKPPVENKSQLPSVLAVQGAGVSKKVKNGRKSVLSTKAKKRQEKSIDRAAVVMDKKSTNIEKSKDRARLVQERAKAWDEHNKKLMAKKARDAALALEKENRVDEDGDVDADGDAMEDVEEAPSAAGPMAVEDVDQSIPLQEPAEEDEVL